MSRFFAGFATASVVWLVLGGSLVALVWTGVIALPHEEPMPDVVAAMDVDAGVATTASPRGRRRGRAGWGGGGGGAGGAHAGGGGGGGDYDPAPEDVLTGDDLGTVNHNLDVGAQGGEEHLTPSQIEQTFDTVLPRIRRCLILVPGNGDIRGRVVFGFRVAHDGHVVAVNLRGPSNITTGEPGDCLRAAGRGARFPSFDGPDTVASYPLDLN